MAYHIDIFKNSPRIKRRVQLKTSDPGKLEVKPGQTRFSPMCVFDIL